MNEITLASGTEEYRINGRAILRFNPSDPAMYKRFKVLVSGVEAVGKEMGNLAVASQTPEVMADMIENCDRRIKDLLAEAFGKENDFNDIFDGCSVFASTGTGEWVITEFFNTIRPIIENAMSASLQTKAAAAHLNREQRRSAQHR